MKKFMKAIALATVLCLALSTAAFAANTADKGNADYTATVNVEAETGTEVALVIISGEETSTSAIDEDNIVYINQMASVNGAASFANVPVKGTPEKVSVFVGYNGLTEGANYVATLTFGPEFNTVAITKRATVKADNGVGMAVEVDVPEFASQMIWAATVNGNRGFSEAIDIAGLKGVTQLGARFLSDANLENLVVENIDVIFNVNGTDYYSNTNDYSYKLGND